MEAEDTATAASSATDAVYRMLGFLIKSQNRAVNNYRGRVTNKREYGLEVEH